MLARERWVEAEAASDMSSTLNPTFAFAHVLEAISCLHLGRCAEARRQVETARRLGAELANALWFDQVFTARHLGHEGRAADIRTLWAETEPGA